MPPAGPSSRRTFSSSQPPAPEQGPATAAVDEARDLDQGPTPAAVSTTVPSRPATSRRAPRRPPPAQPAAGRSPVDEDPTDRHVSGCVARASHQLRPRREFACKEPYGCLVDHVRPRSDRPRPPSGRRPCRGPGRRPRPLPRGRAGDRLQQEHAPAGASSEGLDRPCPSPKGPGPPGQPRLHGQLRGLPDHRRLQPHRPGGPGGLRVPGSPERRLDLPQPAVHLGGPAPDRTELRGDGHRGPG